MSKRLILLLLFLMTLSSLIGFAYLNVEIASGTLKIAAGQQQLADGQKMLEAGKARLASGEHRLQQGESLYHGVRMVPGERMAERLPVAGQVFGSLGHKIAHGQRLVAAGNQKLKAGEAQLAEGQQELQRGMTKIQYAKELRIGSAMGTIVFGTLFIWLAFMWRRR